MIIQRFASALRRQDWFQVVIEVLIVIVGIFLGLQVQALYEERDERVREAEYLVGIYSELGQDLVEIETIIDRHLMYQQMGEFLTLSIENPQLVSERPIYFILSIDMASYGSAPSISSGSFESLNLNGDRDIIGDQQLLYQLTNYYNSISRSAVSERAVMPVIQQNYFELANGILNYQQMKEINIKGPSSDDYFFTEEEALAAYQRMMARPDFIDQIPRATSHGYRLRTYGGWLEAAQKLHAKLGASLNKEPTE